MTQLLVSVKSVEEADLALSAKVDLLDLKDPAVGALGALDEVTTARIVRRIDGRTTISATVGERHATPQSLLEAIRCRVDLGIDIIKIAVDQNMLAAEFAQVLSTSHKRTSKLVAVLFAENAHKDWSQLSTLKDLGFYGAMLDTQSKQNSLRSLLDDGLLRGFLDACQQYQLASGLAGSLKLQDAEDLCRLRPAFIGFRGGVCENSDRTSSLSVQKIEEIRKIVTLTQQNWPKSPKNLDVSIA